MGRVENADIVKRLQYQLGLEAQAALSYLMLSAWCTKNGYGGSAHFFEEQHKEEFEHMMKVFNFLLEHDIMPQLEKVNLKDHGVTNLQQVFEIALEQEKSLTEFVHKTMDLAVEQNDYATVELMRWFVEEQQEEETLFKTILDRFQIININQDNGLHLADEFVKNLR